MKEVNYRELIDLKNRLYECECAGEINRILKDDSHREMILKYRGLRECLVFAIVRVNENAPKGPEIVEETL